jgi:hypothetical protein
MDKRTVRYTGERAVHERGLDITVELSSARSRLAALSNDGKVLYVSLPVARVNPPSIVGAAIAQALDGRKGRAVVFRRPPAKFEAVCTRGHVVLSRNVRNNIAGLMCTRCWNSDPLTWRRRCPNTSPFSAESVY